MATLYGDTPFTLSDSESGAAQVLVVIGVTSLTAADFQFLV
jgi:hypothetical protein